MELNAKDHTEKCMLMFSIKILEELGMVSSRVSMRQSTKTYGAQPKDFQWLKKTHQNHDGLQEPYWLSRVELYTWLLLLMWIEASAIQ